MAGYLFPITGIKYKSHFKNLKTIKMKKVGFLALALGLFVAACNSSSTTNTGDSTTTGADSSINSAVTPDSSTVVAPIDSLAADSSKIAPADSAKH